jgi:TrmH family RNA methyltransferase
MPVAVVLVSTRNPLNIGAAARAMANFGFTDLRVVNAYDVAFREARSAVGAAPLLASAREFPSVAEAVADCKLVVGTTSVGHRGLRHPLRRLEYGARLIRAAMPAAQVALMFGSEKFGLSNEELAHCQWLLRVSTVQPELSMNLGQAVAVCLYELVRDARAGRVQPAKLKSAAAGDLEQVTVLLLDVLASSGYVNPKTAASTADKTRRMVRRLAITDRDAAVLLGMLRQVLWKVRGSSG